MRISILTTAFSRYNAVAWLLGIVISVLSVYLLQRQNYIELHTNIPSSIRLLQACASFGNIFIAVMNLVLTDHFKHSKQYLANMLSCGDLMLAVFYLLSSVLIIQPINDFQNEPMYIGRFVTWIAYLVGFSDAIRANANGNRLGMVIKIAAIVSSISTMAVVRLVEDPSIRFALEIFSLGAMLTLTRGVHQDMDRIIDSIPSKNDKDSAVETVSVDAAKLIKYVALTYPAFPLMVMLLARGWISRMEYEVHTMLGEFIVKGVYIIIIINRDAQTMADRVDQMKDVVQGMSKVLTKTNVNLATLQDENAPAPELNSWIMEQFAGVKTQTSPTQKRRRTTLSDSCVMRDADQQGLALRNWEFESLDMSSPQLITFCVDVLMDLNVDEALHVNRVTLTSLVKDAKKMYNDVPFHNFQHAVLVFHTTYMFVLTLDACWSPLECAAVLLASLCHDLDHRGLNNAYHVATMSELAVRYNDQSVLENHHCSKMFELLRKHKLLAQLSREDVSAMRKTMIDIIMGTDMTRHAAQLAKMESSEGAMLADNEDTRRFLLVVIVHSADLYNAIKPFASSQRWTTRLYKEFNLQCDLERSLGMEPAAFMTASTPVEIAKGQQAFYNYVVIPWFHQVTRVMPDLAFLSKACADNLAEYSKRIEPA